MVELLIVIAVISILAGVVMTALNPLAQLQKARDSQRKSDLTQLQRALEQYYNDNGSYPTSTGSPNYNINGTTWGSAWGNYIQKVPKDPVHQYVYVSGGQSYQLYANLERGSSDAQVCNNGNSCTNAPAGNACGGAICNYGISSPNTTP